MPFDQHVCAGVHKLHRRCSPLSRTRSDKAAPPHCFALVGAALVALSRARVYRAPAHTVWIRRQGLVPGEFNARRVGGLADGNSGVTRAWSKTETGSHTPPAQVDESSEAAL